MNGNERCIVKRACVAYEYTVLVDGNCLHPKSRTKSETSTGTTLDENRFLEINIISWLS